jgi:hypothetical protein
LLLHELDDLESAPPVALVDERLDRDVVALEVGRHLHLFGAHNDGVTFHPQRGHIDRPGRLSLSDRFLTWIILSRTWTTILDFCAREHANSTVLYLAKQ